MESDPSLWSPCQGRREGKRKLFKHSCELTLVCLQPSTMQNLGKLSCRLVVPLEPWLVGCHGAEVAAIPSLTPSLTKISFTSAPTLPSPKKLVSCRGFLPIYLLSGRCHALHTVILRSMLELTGGYWAARWFLMSHRFGERGRKILRCLAVPRLRQQRCPPGELSMLRLSLLVHFMELKKHQVLRHTADASGTSACPMDF